MVCSQLTQGLERLETIVNQKQLDLLERYQKGLAKWNRTYNLTALPEEEWVIKHFLDSAVLIPYLQDVKTLLDVGSGAGFPGMVLAILKPELQVTMLDKVGKKTRFLQQILAELELKNAKSLHARAEEHQMSYDVITARAVAKPDVLIPMTQHLLALDGRYHLLLGKELDDNRLPGWLYQLSDVNVPFQEACRRILTVKRETK